MATIEHAGSGSEASTESPDSPATGGGALASTSGDQSLFSGNRGQASNLTGLIVGIAVAAIVGIGVGIPLINQVVESANLTGITATVVGFIPVMLGLLIFVATASPIMRRT